MNKIFSRNELFLGLALVLVAAFLLRIWGIWFGLPYSFRADEYHEVYRALELGSGGFNLERTGKGGYYYVLFFEYGLLFVTLKIAGIVASAQDFARFFVADPSLFYLIGRATTAFIGALNVFLAYRIGCRAYGAGAAIIAAVFLSVDFLNAEHSHYITVDVPLTCLATAALLFAVRLAVDGRSSDYKWAALFAALATTTKLPGILLLVPLLLAHCYHLQSKSAGIRQFLLSRDLWWSVAIFAAVLAATNPGLIVHPPLDKVGLAPDSDVIEQEDAELMLNVPTNLFVYYFFVIVESMGWPLSILSVAALFYGLWKRTATDIILISYAAVNFVVFASTDSLQFYPRYMLPVIVVLTILAGRLAHVALPRNGLLGKAAAIVLVGVLIGSPAYRTIANNHLLTQADTRALAKDWFDENVAEGSKVMIEGLKVEPSGLTVPLRDTKENMLAKIEYYRKREPAKAKYLSFLVQVDRGTTFDLELVKRSELQDLDFYLSKEVEYFVIRPQTFLQSRKMGSSGRDLIEELQQHPDVRLIKSFRADPRTRPGPDIDIYEARRNTASPAS